MRWTGRTADTSQGIWPPAGYPACPDHTEQATLFSWLAPLLGY
jgi:cobalamin-dependent methionine synthase I